MVLGACDSLTYEYSFQVGYYDQDHHLKDLIVYCDLDVIGTHDLFLSVN